MKTTKKVLAASLAVMMVAATVPFAANAAETYSYTLNCANPGFTVTVYKVADYNETTGKYTVAADETHAKKTEIQSAVDAGNTDQTLLALCNQGDFKTSVETVAFTDVLDTKTTTVAPGVYYVKVTGTPANVKKAENSVFTLPTNNKANTITVEVGDKVDAGEVTVSKRIVEGADRVTSTSEFIGEEITFELKGTIAGSADEKMTSYVLTDTMSDGLDFVRVASVNLVKEDGTTTTPAAYTLNPAAPSADDKTFTISLNTTVLEDNATYDYKDVVVTYVGKLNTNAVIAGDGNVNSVDLTYTNSFGVDNNVEGNDVTVYTGEINIKKVDAAKPNTKLAGATFTLTKPDSSTVTDTTDDDATTTEVDETGTAKFTGLKAGTYKLQETGAPTGYALNATEITFTVSATGTVTCTPPENSGITFDADTVTLTVKDSKLVVPETGGTGTMVFTIVGASLIVCAGVLLLVLKRKNAAK